MYFRYIALAVSTKILEDRELIFFGPIGPNN
jgi:hypothetical protein